MNNISFDSRYKFIISLGIALLASPFLIVFTLYKISKDMLISVDIFNKLTDKSKDIIQIKQDIYLKLLNIKPLYIYIILLIIILLGLGLIFWGLYQWGIVQKQEYRHHELENKQREYEIEKLKKECGLSDEEQLDKIEKQLTNDSEILGTKKNNITRDEYFRIEKIVAKNIIDNFSLTHDVLNAVRVGDVEYDIIAAGKDLFTKDYIFEIKYLTSIITEKWYEQLIKNMYDLATNYSKETNHIPYKQVIIVTEEKNFSQINNFIKKREKINNLNIKVVSRDRIKNLKFS